MTDEKEIKSNRAWREECEALRARVAELEESQKTWNEYYRRQHHPRCDLLEAAGTDSLGNKCTCQQCIKEDVLGALKASQCEPVGIFGGKRYTPEHTTEFWGNLLMDDVKVGDLLYTSSPTIPDGWKLVPVEPTEEMFAGWFSVGDQRSWQFNDRYSAMLAAAPEYEGDK